MSFGSLLHSAETITTNFIYAFGLPISIYVTPLIGKSVSDGRVKLRSFSC
jgi:hypothetical protein